MVVLRCVNDSPSPLEAAVTLLSPTPTHWTWNSSTIHGASPQLNNTPAMPRLVAPVAHSAGRVSSSCGDGESDSIAALSLAPFSFTVATFRSRVKTDDFDPRPASPPAPGPMTKRCVPAGSPEAAGACLDGSPYCFYEQLIASSARWAFFFEGGGACDDEQG